MIPQIILMSVVLPAPFDPSNPITPGRRSALIRSTATVPGYCFVT
jgi:hypothetical protein